METANEDKTSLGCGLYTIKYTLVCINIAFFIFAILLIGLGVTAYSMGHIRDFMTVPTLAIGIIVLGGFVLLVSFFGCCGAHRQSKTLIGIYIGIVFLIMVGQMGIGIAAYGFHSDVEGWVKTGWNTINNQTRDWVEQEFSCCGFYNSTDTPGYCPPQTTKGCYYALVDYVKGKLLIVEIAALSIGCVEIFGLILSFCLCARMPNVRKLKQERLLQEAKKLNRSDIN